MASYDPARSAWMNPDIEYLFDQEIIEYDMRDAGFSLIKQYHLVSPEQMKELVKLGKGDERHIAIGKMEGKDKAFSRALLEKFTDMRRIFIGANNLRDSDIVTVKKDAIFTIGPCEKTKFGEVLFVPKNRYTSYLRLTRINNIEIFYSAEKVDVKGMGDSAVDRHRLYMMEFIQKIIRMIESKDRRVRRTIMGFIEQYKGGTVDEAFYMEFNNKSSKPDPVHNYMNLLIPLLQIVIREVK